MVLELYDARARLRTLYRQFRSEDGCFDLGWFDLDIRPIPAILLNLFLGVFWDFTVWTDLVAERHRFFHVKLLEWERLQAASEQGRALQAHCADTIRALRDQFNTQIVPLRVDQPVDGNAIQVPFQTDYEENFLDQQDFPHCYFYNSDICWFWKQPSDHVFVSAHWRVTRLLNRSILIAVDVARYKIHVFKNIPDCITLQNLESEPFMFPFCDNLYENRLQYFSYTYSDVYFTEIALALFDLKPAFITPLRV